MGTVNIFLGPSATSQSSADYTLSGWDKDGAALTLTSWSWTETGNGGYVISHANLIPGCSYWLRKTSGGTPWAHGEIGANVIADIQSGLATAAQVAAIGSGTGAALNFEAVEDNATGLLPPVVGTAKTGTQTLTYAATTADNATYHDIAHAGNAIDWVYGFSVGGGRNASKVTFNGQYIVAAPVAGKNINVYAWNFTGTPAWQLMKTIAGQITGGTDVTVDIALLSAHTGTGASAGKVYIRFEAATNAVTLKVDQLLLQAQNLGQSIGYANGSIWVEADGGNTGTTPYVDGTGDNPCTYAAMKTLNGVLGLNRYTVTPNTTITLNESLANSVMLGRSYTLALGGQNISKSYFEGIESLTGTGTTATGEAIFVDCHVATAVGPVSLGEFDFVRCHIHGTVTLATASKYYRMHDCTGIENATVEFGAATQTLALSKMSGAFTITGMATGDTLYVDGSGVLTLGATCTGGTVHISGSMELTNSGSGQTITYDGTTTNASAIKVKTDYLPSISPGSANGLFIAGSNASTTVEITGSISGSIGSLGIQAKADVNAEVDTALTDIHLDHLFAADYDPASKPGVATALLNELVESDAGVSRFTANTLEEAPTGTGSGLTAQQTRDAMKLAPTGGAAGTGSIDDLLITTGVKLANGAHGGASARLTLGDGLSVSRATGDAATFTGGTDSAGMNLTGNGTGNGLKITGANGSALAAVTTGTGHAAVFQAKGSGIGVVVMADDSTGLYIEGGQDASTGHGIEIIGNGTDKHGISIAGGTGVGKDIYAPNSDLGVAATVDEQSILDALDTQGYTAARAPNLDYLDGYVSTANGPANRAYFGRFIALNRVTGFTASLVSGSFATGQGFAIYKVDINTGSYQEIGVFDDTLTFTPDAGNWSDYPSALNANEILKIETIYNSTSVSAPIVIDLTLSADIAPPDGETVRIILPENAAGNDRCWYVAPDGELTFCNSGLMLGTAPTTSTASATSRQSAVYTT